MRRVGGGRILLTADDPFDMEDGHRVETAGGLAEVGEDDQTTRSGETARALMQLDAEGAFKNG